MDITNIFKSRTRKELFRLFFTNPESEYYLRELERVLDTPASMLRTELLRLVESGIFNSFKKGNLVYYSLKKSYPLYDELKSMVFKTIGIKGTLQNILEKTKRIKTAFIYGSYAKNEEHANSDIDVFIIGLPDEDVLAVDIRKLEKNLKREINYTLYSVDDFKKKKREKNSFIMDLLEKPKIFLKGDKNDL
ncbi:MAG: nucleotidyltransferase domain-containing protein [bacterium]|nr:nucleotidyltransferase domain-containing protein [bacterium]